MTIKYTILKSEKSITEENRVSDLFRFETSFDELFDLLLDATSLLKKKEDGAFLIGADFKSKDDPTVVLTYEGYVRRLAENINMVTILALDVDGGMEVDEARELFEDYTHIMYSSFNHMKDGVHKFRVLFELKEPVTPSEWSLRTKSMVKMLGGDEVVDKTCLYLSHGFYLPCWNKDNENDLVLEINYGKPVDVMALKKKKIVPFTGEPTDLTDTEKLELLDKLRDTSIPSYNDWWQMVQAMKSEGFGLQDVLYVSCNNHNHISPTTGIKDDNQCTSTFNQVREQSGGIGKLINYVREGGHPDYKKSGLNKKVSDLDKQLKELQKTKNKLANKRIGEMS